MKFTLKDYQTDAVREVLERLADAKDDWRRPRPRKSAFSLTAATGAGKTVMAAAVFEALFHGDDDLDFDADQTAVVIWFSDDPSLNEQTRFRLMEASDRLNGSDMKVVETSFNAERFDAGKIYFLNTQKLGRNSLLTRGADEREPELPMPDLRAYTIWDTIQNTVEDPDRTLYLVLDEAHRGMSGGGSSAEARSTIVQRLINGERGAPAMPIVWGISATVERFNRAMAVATDRATLPNVVVDSGRVQESGLLKDTIALDVPDEEGQFRTVLVRRGADKLKEVSTAWADYAKAQGEPTMVRPLMVLQVENKPNPKEIGEAIDTILQRWPELSSAAFAHVFGDHTTQTFGAHAVPYISPERVEDEASVRVLIAKDAISTGWDCPRAEVMVSFRPAKDPTHITQLLGRMVRAPLARRIPGNERLNAVDCLLPFFDAKSVTAVADALMTGRASGDDNDESGPPIRRVLINAKEMTPNPAVPEEVWEALLNLPSQSLPQRAAKPVKRLTILAHELAFDGLKPNAGKLAHAAMHRALDAAAVQYADKIEAARQGVLTVEGKTLIADLRGGRKSLNDFVEKADNAVINDAFQHAARQLSLAMAKSYVEYKADPEAEDEVEALMDARVLVASMGLVPEVRSYLEAEAEKLANNWFSEHRVDIRGLSDERQDVYRSIQGSSADVQEIAFAKPSSWMLMTTAKQPDGSEKLLPTYSHHLLCGPDGLFPAELNDWESRVLEREMGRDGFVAWYRNPSRASQDSMGVSYKEGDADKILRPDFVIFSRKADGSVVADILDPHGFHLSDALPKLRGLATWARRFAGRVRRVEALAVVDEELRVLDLTDEETRNILENVVEVKAAYQSSVAHDF